MRPPSALRPQLGKPETPLMNGAAGPLDTRRVARGAEQLRARE